MRKIIKYIFSLLLFWLLLFDLNRLIFLAVQYPLLQKLSPGEIAASFRYAFPVDLSAACYTCVFPFLLVLTAYITGRKMWLSICRYLVLLFLLLHCMIAYGETGLYTQWQSKLNYQALAHFAHPSEVFSTVSWGLMILFFGLTAVLGVLFFMAYNRWIHPATFPFTAAPLKRRAWTGALILATGGFLLLTGIRGGWKRFPLSESRAFYSSHAVLNDAAVNPAWGLANSLKEYSRIHKKNPFALYPPETAAAVADSLFYVPRDTTVSILTTTRPNIVFFILESWTSDALQNPGNIPITPVMDSLIHGGVYFDRCYATGFVSDQGVPGTLSAFPACYGFSVCTDPVKSEPVPAINEVLGKAGYQTGFIYGGQLDFGNIRSYIYNKKFNLVRAGMDFPLSMPRSSLGIPDGVLVDSVATLLDHAQGPFFYCWYTLSSHMPYDIPAAPALHPGSHEDPFLNSMHYSDLAIGALFKKIRTKPWYKNTLFVFVSDHSHESQYTRAVQDKDRHRIPLLFYGDVIKPEWRGRTIPRITSQLDIAATLLAQLGLSHAAFPWSKNLFNPYAPAFAAYNYWNGAGLVTPQGFVAFDNRFPDFLLTDLKDSSRIKRMLRSAHVLQQKAYDYFLKW